MKRFKLFIENFLVYGLGGIISKVVPLIMLPIVTRLMPNSFYYGLNDISNIVISFGSAFAIMGMYDAMFRMFFEKNDEKYKKDICSSAFYFTISTAILVFLIIIVFKEKLSVAFFGSDSYGNLIIVTALSILIGSTNSIVSAPTRMNNKRKIFLITNTLSPIISYSIAVPMLMKEMYVMALPIASLIASLMMLITFYLLNNEWFSFKGIKLNYIKEMLSIGVPLMPNFIFYWVFNSFDRLMIGKMIGNEFVGMYGIGARVAQVSQLIYTAFSGGWQYFSFYTMKDKDQVKMTSNIFEYLGAISFCAAILITPICYPIFQLFFKGDYVNGYIVAPYLFLSPLLLMLFQTGCNQFLIIKKTWPNFIILAVGAILNIWLNAILIPKMGIEGAAIATLLGYVVSVVLCIWILTKRSLLKLTKRFWICFICLVAYFLLWRIVLERKVFVNIILAIIFTVFIVLQYKRELNLLKGKIFKRGKHEYVC